MPLLPAPQFPSLPTIPFVPAPLVIDQKRINPQVALLVLLDDLNVTLLQSKKLLSSMEQALEKILESQQKIPLGVVETFDDISVASTSEQVFDTIAQVEQKFFSATVYNEGSDDIMVRANDGFPWETSGVYQARKSRYITLAQGESINIDFHAPLLRYIYYKLAPGGSSAAMKIVGEW